MATLAFTLLADIRVLVSYQGTDNPSDAEWDGYLSALGDAIQSRDDFRFLVVTEGGHPTHAQQRRLADVVHQAGGKGKRKPNVAIVSPALILRFIVSVLALLNPQVRYFAPHEERRALTHLGLSVSERATVENAVTRLRKAVNDGSAA